MAGGDWASNKFSMESKVDWKFVINAHIMETHSEGRRMLTTGGFTPTELLAMYRDCMILDGLIMAGLFRDDPDYRKQFDETMADVEDGMTLGEMLGTGVTDKIAASKKRLELLKKLIKLWRSQLILMKRLGLVGAQPVALLNAPTADIAEEDYEVTDDDRLQIAELREKLSSLDSGKPITSGRLEPGEKIRQ
jgi:hypothetical protein